MITSLRHVLGWMVSAFSSREYLILATEKKRDMPGQFPAATAIGASVYGGGSQERMHKNWLFFIKDFSTSPLQVCDLEIFDVGWIKTRDLGGQLPMDLGT
jgi:hypothetical protein